MPCRGETGRLKALRQLLTRYLLDNPRPRKADQCPGSAITTSATVAYDAVTPP